HIQIQHQASAKNQWLSKVSDDLIESQDVSLKNNLPLLDSVCSKSFKCIIPKTKKIISKSTFSQIDKDLLCKSNSSKIIHDISTRLDDTTNSSSLQKRAHKHWTAEEENYLLDGVKKYGKGAFHN
ncbi:hypothetical protein MXB_1729, partial [Myxobolus squamalis]